MDRMEMLSAAIREATGAVSDNAALCDVDYKSLRSRFGNDKACAHELARTFLEEASESFDEQ